MRPARLTGVAHLQTLAHGGLLLTVMDTTDLAVRPASPPVVHRPASAAAHRRSAVRIEDVDPTSPIAYGYTDNLALWCDNGPIFNVSASRCRGGRRLGPDDGGNRPTGRAPPTTPTRRRTAGVDIPVEPKVDTWQAGADHRRTTA